mmetsp:Transcript_14901/g.38054  ORF Transcript_14901/g.38054 Transcript_14901/m.38054 type:complete len:204 (+) Transcript_14901:716-1327(+)
MGQHWTPVAVASCLHFLNQVHQLADEDVPRVVQAAHCIIGREIDFDVALLGPLRVAIHMKRRRFHSIQAALEVDVRIRSEGALGGAGRVAHIAGTAVFLVVRSHFNAAALEVDLGRRSRGGRRAAHRRPRGEAPKAFGFARRVAPVLLLRLVDEDALDSLVFSAPRLGWLHREGFGHRLEGGLGHGSLRDLINGRRHDVGGWR